MMYVNAETGEAMTVSQIRIALPDVSLREGADLSSFGYLPLEPSEPPLVSIHEVAVHGPPEEYEPGKWRQTWEIEPAPLPESVTALQGMMAIQQAGLVQAFLAWKATLNPAQDFEAIAYFEKATHWRYDSHIINEALRVLGVVEQKDALFRLAASIDV
jgi:hypothetical protein